MKTLILARHAEPSRGVGADVERGLTALGETQAYRLGENLLELSGRVEAVYCSRARRSRETANILAGVLGAARAELPDLYDAYAEDIADELRYEISGAYDKVMAVGHNPEIGRLIGILSAESGVHLLPATAYVLDFDTEAWSEIGTENCIGWQTVDCLPEREKANA